MTKYKNNPTVEKPQPRPNPADMEMADEPTQQCPMSEQAKSNPIISLCSYVNWSNAAMHTAMYIITESKEPIFNIFLVQESWWEKINQEYCTVSFPGWQTILPK